MKKVAITVLGVLTLTASANAQGTWYTDYATWKSLITNDLRAAYVIEPSGSSPWTEAGVTAAAGSGAWIKGATPGSLSTQSLTPVTFTFNGNSFGGLFSLNYQWSKGGRFVQWPEVMNFSIDGSITNTQSLTTSINYTFLGYISNSATPISVTATNSAYFVDVNSFSFGQSTSSLSANYRNNYDFLNI